MTFTAPDLAPSPPRSLREPLPVGVAALVIVLATVAFWASSFAGALVFDDVAAIRDNPSIRHLWPLGGPLSPPSGGSAVSGRPLINLTLAVNYAISSARPWSYHALNLLIHLLAGLTLFGIVRRTWRHLARPGSTPLALAVALLWVLHPLQTESVTYVVQRAESLMGLLYLLTLYCFIRGSAAPAAGGATTRAAGWYVLAVLCCLLGMAAKEVMATAPLLVLLYDRAFLSGTFREAWRRHGRWHLALMATWLLLAGLVAASGGNRGGTAGFDLAASPGDYWLTQCAALPHYLRLAFWPHPLVADYGAPLVKNAAAVWWRGAAVLALVALTVWALARRPQIGFLGAWFFGILAPTSIVPVATQTITEHRLYLPLAAVAALVVVGLHAAVRRPAVTLAIAAVLALPLGALTIARNRVYGSEQSFWLDVLARRPDNFRPDVNLGNLALARGRLPEAIRYFEAALRLEPDLPDTESNLSNALGRAGQPAAAVAHGLAALRLQPDLPDAHVNVGNALLALGRPAEAITHYEAALRRQPGAADVEVDLGTALATAGRPGAAISQFQAALQRRPDDAPAHLALAILLARAGRLDEAAAEFRQTVRLEPDNLRARDQLASALLLSGHPAAAAAEYEEMLRRNPNDEATRQNLEDARAMQRAAPPSP